MNEEEQVISIECDGGRVIIATGTGNYTFPPDVAVQIANTILQAVQVCGFEVKVEADRTRQISDLKRNELIVRTDHVLRTLKGKPTMYIAKAVVDTVLTAIL